MTNEEKAYEIASKYERWNIEDDESAGAYKGALEMARWKDELIKNFKHHADEMYYAMKNLSTDGSQVRKAMEDYHNFLFKEYYNN